MKYRLRDLPRMLATPGGRLQVRDGIGYNLYPLLARLAHTWRRTVVRRTRVIAVVGSFGKSTTTRAVSAALGVAIHPRALYNAFTWLASAVLRIRPGQAHAVIEAGIAAPGEMERYARMIRPDLVVVTSIGSEGSPKLGSLDDIRDQKSWMVRALGASGTAVLNADDPRVAWMASVTTARVVRYGFAEGCDVRGRDLRLDWPRGSRLRVDAFGESCEFAVRLVGRHMMVPVLAAIAVAIREGVPLAVAAERLAALEPTPGRMQPLELPGGVTMLRDDFKSTIETLHAALDVFAEVPATRRIVVFGDVTEPPADRAPVYEALGERIAAIADRLVVFGPSLADYAAGARRAGLPDDAIHDGGRTPQRTVAVLRALLRPGDAVLLKGRRGQKLDRVRLLLAGATVDCDVPLCDLQVYCADCPMRERGWHGRPRVVERDLR